MLLWCFKWLLGRCYAVMVFQVVSRALLCFEWLLGRCYAVMVF